VVGETQTGPIDGAVQSAKALAESKANRQLHVAPVSLTNHSKSVELKDLRSSLETWGKTYSEYVQRTSDQLIDPTRLCLQAQCPAALQAHLELHVAWLSTYDLMRCEVEAYLDVKLPSSSTWSCAHGRRHPPRERDENMSHL